MKLIPIDRSNIAAACRIQHTLFQEPECNADRDALKIPIYIMSKSLYPGRECPPWDNRDISLWYQFSKQGERIYE
jgi:hypothetical protein